MAILIAVPPGIAANQDAANNLTGNLGTVITQTEAAINQTLTQIQCSLTQSAPNGFGLTQSSGSGFAISGGIPSGGGGTGPEIRYGQGPNGGGSMKPMNESQYTDINNTLSGVAAVEPLLQVVEGHNQTVTPHIITSGGSVPANMPTSFNIIVPDYIITGVPLNSSLIDNYPILPTNITQGRNLQEGDTGDVLLSENCSAYFNVGVGDKVQILNETFMVVGIYSPTGTSDNQLAYMDLASAQRITNSSGIITQLNVFTNTKDDVNNVVSQLNAIHPELNCVTAQDRLNQLNQMESIYNSQLKQAQDTMAATQTQAVEEIGIAVAATSVIVLFVMLYTVRERTKEIGTLKAMGASNSTVMGQFLVEGILLSVIAGIVAVAIGTVAAPYLSSVLLPAVGGMGATGGATVVTVGSTSPTPVAVSPQYMLIGFATAIVLGAVGSMYPAWRAAKTRPAEAMRYE